MKKKYVFLFIRNYPCLLRFSVPFRYKISCERQYEITIRCFIMKQKLRKLLGSKKVIVALSGLAVVVAKEAFGVDIDHTTLELAIGFICAVMIGEQVVKEVGK